MEELDLREVVRVLQRRWKLLAILPLLMGLVAGLITYFLLTPTYQATTTLWVIKEDTAQLTYNDVMMYRYLTKSYAEVAKSRSIMEDVIDRLDLVGITPEDLKKKITVSAVKDTDLLSISVEYPDPTLASRIANAVAASFQQKISTMMNVENVAVVDQAVVPTEPSEPNLLTNIAVAVVLGGMAAVGAAFLIEYMDVTVRSPEDVTRHTGLPVLATIPDFGTRVRVSRHRRRFRPERKEASA